MFSALQIIELENSKDKMTRVVGEKMHRGKLYTGNYEIANKLYHLMVEENQEGQITKKTKLSQLHKYRDNLEIKEKDSEEVSELQEKFDIEVLEKAQLLDTIQCLGPVVKNSFSTLIFTPKERIQEFITFAQKNEKTGKTEVDKLTELAQRQFGKESVETNIDLVGFYQNHPSIFSNTNKTEFENMIVYTLFNLQPELKRMGYNDTTYYEFMERYSYLFMEKVETVENMFQFIKQEKLTYLLEESLSVLCGSRKNIEKKLKEAKKADKILRETTHKNKRLMSQLKSSPECLLNSNVSKLIWNPSLISKLDTEPKKRIPKRLLSASSLKLFEKIVLLHETPVQTSGEIVVNPSVTHFARRLSNLNIGYDTLASRILYSKKGNNTITTKDMTAKNYRWDMNHVNDNTQEIQRQYYENQMNISEERTIFPRPFYKLPELENYQIVENETVSTIMEQLDEKLHNYHQLSTYQIGRFQISRFKVSMYLQLIDGPIQEIHIKEAILSNVVLPVKQYKELENQVVSMDFSFVESKKYKK